MMKYWEECISEAFDYAGITASSEQLKTVAEWVEGAHENHGLATGRECIPNPLETELAEAKRQHAESDKRRERTDRALRDDIAGRYGAEVWVDVVGDTVEVTAAL